MSIRQPYPKFSRIIEKYIKTRKNLENHLYGYHSKYWIITKEDITYDQAAESAFRQIPLNKKTPYS